MCLMMMELDDEVIKKKKWIVMLREGDGYIKNIEKDLKSEWKSGQHRVIGLCVFTSHGL